MTKLDMLSPIALSELEQTAERTALERVYDEVCDPVVDEAHLRAVAHELATELPGFALQVEVPKLLEDFYEPRAVTSQTETGAKRTDFATREYDEQNQAPGEALDGWFTVFDDGSLRYAFSYTNLSQHDYPGATEGDRRPYAITVAPDQSVEVTTMTYRKGASQEVAVRDAEQRQTCIEQAFYSTFLAARRMSQRGPEEREAANVDAQAKLLRAKRSLENSQHIYRESQDEMLSETSFPEPDMTDGPSWVIPADFHY